MEQEDEDIEEYIDVVLHSIIHEENSLLRNEIEPICFDPTKYENETEFKKMGTYLTTLERPKFRILLFSKLMFQVLLNQRNFIQKRNK
jgi:hypothetical protein